MILQKDNVQKIVKTEREIAHLKALGYREVRPARDFGDTRNGGDGGQAGKTPALSAELTVKELKQKLDDLGVEYNKNAKKEELQRVYEEHTAGDAE